MSFKIHDTKIMANAIKDYKAKSVKIGLIEDTKCYQNPNGFFYIDIIESDGHQQTIATGDYEYVKSFIEQIIFI